MLPEECSPKLFGCARQTYAPVDEAPCTQQIRPLGPSEVGYQTK